MRSIACTLALLVVAGSAFAAESPYPQGQPKPALTFPQFPDRLHTFVFRNWGLVESARLAHVVGADEGKVRALAVAMGLPEHPDVAPQMLSRGYVTLIRRNW